MKNKAFIIAFLALALPLAAQLASIPGVKVQVELTSGTSQTAQFLGMEKDTVLLGGYINGTFTSVRLHRSLFKSVQDTNGNILNLDSLRTNPEVATAAAQEPVTEIPKIDWKGKILILPMEHRAIDSALAYRLSDITFQMLLDQGKNPKLILPNDLLGCTRSDCFIAKAKENGAEALYSSVISPAKEQDSLNVEYHTLFFANDKTYKTSIKLSARNATQEILSDNKWVLLLENAEGKKSTPQSTKSFISVDTDPDGASLAKTNGDVICHTPCTFATQDTGRISLEAFWRVDNHLWAAQTVIFPISGDTAKTSLKLKRVQPEIEIMSTPSGAEIYTDEAITVKSKSLGTTPKVYSTLEPGDAQLHLWKPGYQDTIVPFHVNALGKVIVNATLSPLIDPQEIEAQKAFINAKKRRSIGFTLIGSALAPLVAGGILVYLANENYDRAKDIRDELKLPSSSQGPNYQEKLKKNKRYADRGDAELYTGISLFGVAAAMASIGWVFTF